VIAGLCLRLARAAGPAFSANAVVAGALIALAIGVGVPQRFVVRACCVAWRRFMHPDSSPDWVVAHIGQDAPDRPLHGLVISLLALCGGVGALVLPLTTTAAETVHATLHAWFLWPAPTNLVLDASIALVTAAIPLVPWGVAMCGLHHLCCPRGQWDGRATAWGLIGAGGGLLCFTALARMNLHSNVLLTAAGLPALIVALGVALLGGGGAEQPWRDVGIDAPVPIQRDRWPGLLRGALVAIAGGGACAATVWLGHLGPGAPGRAIFLAVMPAALGAGMLFSRRAARSAGWSIAGFGTACSAAGVATAVGVLVMRGGVVAGAFETVTIACLGLGGIGYATAHGSTALGARVASRAAAGAQELARSLACAGVTVLVTAPLAIHLFGHPAAMLMLALSLVAVGGTLVIHDAADPRRLRRARLSMVFASLFALIVLSVITRRPLRSAASDTPALPATAARSPAGR